MHIIDYLPLYLITGNSGPYDSYKTFSRSHCRNNLMSTAPTGYPAQALGGFGGFPAQYGYGAQYGAQFGAPQQYPGGVERQVVPEFVQVPVSQTVLVPQTTYQQRYVQVPVQQTIQVPRVVRFVCFSTF